MENDNLQGVYSSHPIDFIAEHLEHFSQKSPASSFCFIFISARLSILHRFQNRTFYEPSRSIKRCTFYFFSKTRFQIAVCKSCFFRPSVPGRQIIGAFAQRPTALFPKQYLLFSPRNYGRNYRIQHKGNNQHISYFPPVFLQFCILKMLSRLLPLL